MVVLGKLPLSRGPGSLTHIFKIQVAGQPAKTSDEISSVEDFLRSFLPTLERAGIGSKRNEAGTQ